MHSLDVELHEGNGEINLSRNSAEKLDTIISHGQKHNHIAYSCPNHISSKHVDVLGPVGGNKSDEQQSPPIKHNQIEEKTSVAVIIEPDANTAVREAAKISA